MARLYILWHRINSSLWFLPAILVGFAIGLAIGLAIAGVSTHLHLVSSVEPLVFNTVLYKRKLAEALDALRDAGLSCARKVDSVLARGAVTFEIDHGQVGHGYGVPTPAARHAIERLKQIVPIWKKEHYADGATWIGSEADYQRELGRNTSPTDIT